MLLTGIGSGRTFGCLDIFAGNHATVAVGRFDEAAQAGRPILTWTATWQHADPARMTAIGSRGVLMWGYTREGKRMRPRLRLFTGDDEGGTAVAEPTVSISFGEFARIVADARRFDRTFLTDFEEDTVQVPEDLYEVLTAYWRLRPGA